MLQLAEYLNQHVQVLLVKPSICYCKITTCNSMLSMQRPKSWSSKGLHVLHVAEHKVGGSVLVSKIRKQPNK